MNTTSTLLVSDIYCMYVFINYSVRGIRDTTYVYIGSITKVIVIQNFENNVLVYTRFTPLKALIPNNWDFVRSIIPAFIRLVKTLYYRANVNLVLCTSL